MSSPSSFAGSKVSIGSNPVYAHPRIRQRRQVCPNAFLPPNAPSRLTVRYSIKSRVNRASVVTALTSTQQKLKLYNKTPPNGLVIFAGTIVSEAGKEKRVTIDFEPMKPMSECLRYGSHAPILMHLPDFSAFVVSLRQSIPYHCPLGNVAKGRIIWFQQVSQSARCSNASDLCSIVIIDGKSTLFGTLCGTNRQVLQKVPDFALFVFWGSRLMFPFVKALRRLAQQALSRRSIGRPVRPHRREPTRGLCQTRGRARGPAFRRE